jgi:hypothetical protein
VTARDEALARLEHFVGAWTVDVVFPETSPIGPARGTARSSFEWAIGGAFLQQDTRVDHPDAPDSLALVDTTDDGSYTQHYFDSRGVARVYAMTFDGELWALTRERPDFRPLDFAQRFTATIEDGGRVMRGAWEINEDGRSWHKDFDMIYTRA